MSFSLGNFVKGFVQGWVSSMLPISALIGIGFATRDRKKTSIKYQQIQTSGYGGMLPIVHGSTRVAGNIIWANDIKIIEIRRGDELRQSFTATIAIALCEGEVSEVSRAWVDGHEINIATAFQQTETSAYEIFYGSETQEPSEIIESFEGEGNIPAYRGVCYIVIKDFPLADYNNAIPNFTFEIRKTVFTGSSLESKIKAVNLIPGSGEFVYDSTIVTKTINDLFWDDSVLYKLNNVTSKDKSDSEVAIDRMVEDLPNLEWVAVVINWFCTSKDPAILEIVPKVENHSEISMDEETFYTEPVQWEVAGISRNDAELVLQDENGNVTYGGTPNDKGVLDICKYLKNKGLNVMLYPMPLVDTLTYLDEDEDNKPWRGRIVPSSAADVTRFFSGAGGYNDFIRHYSQLSIGGEDLKDFIDAFVIGSELVGLTTYSDTTGSYPAVDELIDLAALVKADVGVGVNVTYAADWTEYHSIDGWFHLDPLWSCDDIDIVGIDNYMPLTEDLPQRQITYQKIKDGWTQDEGWDYFYNEARTVQTAYSGFVFAWKNFEYWWKNTHTNPDTNVTDWTPKMKPVWFTEFGFPSVDGASNQPNVFYDPSSVESFFPRGSKGIVDYLAQRQALDASIDFFTELNAETGNEDLIPVTFTWAYDARPFPYFPSLLDIWADGTNYPFGHWINGKSGTASLDAVVLAICIRAGLTSNDVDVTALQYITVIGHILSEVVSAREAIEELSVIYQFVATEQDGKIVFILLGSEDVVSIEENDVVAIEEGNRFIAIKQKRNDDTTLPNKVSITCFSQLRDYDTLTQSSYRQIVQSKQQLDIQVPLVLLTATLKNACDINLYRAWVERIEFTFILPQKYIYLVPSDVITITSNSVTYTIRLNSCTVLPNYTIEVTAVSTGQSVFNLSLPEAEPAGLVKPFDDGGKTLVKFLDLPTLKGDTGSDAVLRFAFNGQSSKWRGAILYESEDGGELGGNTFESITSVNIAAIVGVSVDVLGEATHNNFDYANDVTVFLSGNSVLSNISESKLLNGGNLALLGNEIIQFQNVQSLGNRQYKLTKLLRGRYGTEHEAGSHVIGDRFILLDTKLIKQSRSAETIGQERFYKAVSYGKSLGVTDEEDFTYTGKTLRPYSPVHINGTRDGSDNLTITWIRRTRINGGWKDKVDVPLAEETERYEIDVMDGVDVVRTLTSTSQSVTYSAAQQTTDFGSTQSSVEVNIYQISATYGRGVPGNEQV